MELRATIFSKLKNGKIDNAILNEIIYTSPYYKKIFELYWIVKSFQKIIKLYKDMIIHINNYPIYLDPTLIEYIMDKLDISYLEFQKYCYLLVNSPPGLRSRYYLYNPDATQESKSYISYPYTGWNRTTFGKRKEEDAINILNKTGYAIASIDSKSRLMTDIWINSRNLVIKGRPDGYIKQSPGNIYNGWVLEIKSFPLKEIRHDTMLQICAYSIIYDTNVLLVSIGKENRLHIRPETKEKLAKYWQQHWPEIKECLSQYEKLLDINSISDYQKVTKILKQLS